MHSIVKKTILASALLILAAQTFAFPTITSLIIDVDLLDNGDAQVVETRLMHIDSECTELYIVIGNLNGSTIKDFSVCDENGTQYMNIGKWDPSRSREAKNGQCGIVTKTDGYELCWGMGEEGNRVYTVKYVVTNLLKSYTDFDGFNFMFVAKDINPSPEQAVIRLHRHGDIPLEEGTVRMWAFGFNGDINYDDGDVFVESEGKLDGCPMIVMLEFDKGVFHPVTKVDDRFENVKNKAFEDSDYGEDGQSQGFISEIRKQPTLLVIPLMIIIVAYFMLSKFIKRRKLRKKVNKDLMWYRELPYHGNLQKANAVMNTLKGGKHNYKNLVSATALRLISMGTLRIEEHFVEASRLKKLFGGEGKNMRLITIGELNESKNFTITGMMRKLYELFLDASGEDHILQPKEFKHFINKNKQRLIDFMDEMKYEMSIKECNKDLENVRQVAGLKKYLEDFTLANERGVAEVGLWGEYLVYAELFGIADQVRKEMLQLNPEFLKMDDMYQAMFDDELVRNVTALSLLTYNSGSSAVAASRSDGGGGSSSFGGGGGFSGGGSGGGAR